MRDRDIMFRSISFIELIQTFTTPVFNTLASRMKSLCAFSVSKAKHVLADLTWISIPSKLLAICSANLLARSVRIPRATKYDDGKRDLVML